MLMSPKNIPAGILCRRETGDGHINPFFVAHENVQDARKSVQKSSKSFKLREHNVVKLAQEQILQKYGFPRTFVLC